MRRPALCATVIEAGKQLGLEYREDVNDLQPGAGNSIGWCQQTRGGRRRAITNKESIMIRRPRRDSLRSAIACLARRSLTALALAAPLAGPGQVPGDHQWGHYPDTTPLYGYLKERDLLDPNYPPLIP